MINLFPLTQQEIESYLQYFFPKSVGASCSITEVKEVLQGYINYTNPYQCYKINDTYLIEALRKLGYSMESDRCNISPLDLSKVLSYTLSCPDKVLIKRIEDDLCFCVFYVESVRRYVQKEEHESITLIVNKEGKLKEVFTYEDVMFYFCIENDILFAHLV